MQIIAQDLEKGCASGVRPLVFQFIYLYVYSRDLGLFSLCIGAFIKSWMDTIYKLSSKIIIKA